MRQFYLQLKDLYYDNETGIRKRMIFSSFCIVVGLVIVFWFLIRLLYFEGYWNTSENINLNVVGQIGDFIGGLSGTFFTLVGVLLLFETLALQRKELMQSRKVFEKQQFETTYFNLINLYQEIVKSLHLDYTETSSERVHNGKDYFEQLRSQFYDGFHVEELFWKNRKQAKIKYGEFYTSTKEQTSHYFRTLYRIFRVISTSNFNEEEKMQYAKIVRAQLSESELFFIHYNAYSEYGSQFRQLINEFNILKHLPYLEKVEFKGYAEKLEGMEKNSVELVLDDIKNTIKKSLRTQENNKKIYLAGTFVFKVIPENDFSFVLQISKRENLLFNTTHQRGYGMSKFDIDTTEILIMDFFYDLFWYSNYFEFNGRDILIKSIKSSDESKNKQKITISVSDKKLNPIKFN